MVKTIAKYVLLVAAILLISLRLATLKPQPPDRLKPSPSPSPQGPDYIGWKEFKNETYGYQIKYPHSWYFHQNLNPPPPTTIHLSTVPEEKNSAPNVSVEIFTDKRNGRTLTNYEEITSLTSQGSVARELKVDQSPAVLIDNLGDTGDLANLYIEHGDYIYRLSWHGTHPDVKSQHKDQCLAIMASLTFLD